MKTVNVAAAVIRDGNRIFATQRGNGKYKDFWEFPCGKIEKTKLRKRLSKERSAKNLTPKYRSAHRM
jgi:ADP-ribose pyrophosphatase YjhB (NUDIX family)